MNETLKKIQIRAGLTGKQVDGQFGPTTAKALQEHLQMSAIEASHFLGQCAIETGWYTTFSENLNYSAAKLQKLFSAFRDPLVAKKYEYNPEAIANRAYANRGGNGPEGSGDGWKWRGRGMIQTTLYENYLLLSRSMNRPEILENPDLVATELCLDSAVHYWNRRKLVLACSSLSLDASRAVTMGINGPGLVHLKERQEATLKVAKWLNL